MNFVTNVYGRGYSSLDVQATLEGMRSGDDIIVSYAKISDLYVNNANITSLSASKITAGTLDLTRGIEVSSSGSSYPKVNISSRGLTGYNSNSASTFSIDTYGTGVLGVNSATAISWGTGGTVAINGVYFESGTISAAKIINLAAGKISGGTMDLSKGIIIKTSSTTANSITMDTYGLTGYGGGTAQFYLQASDGKAYAGAGAVVLSQSGLLINNEGTVESILTIQNTTDYKTWIFQRLTGTLPGFYITCDSGNIVVSAQGSFYFNSGNRYVLPPLDTTYNLGSTALRWNVEGWNVYAPQRFKIANGEDMYEP
jgi:hypothetical protein